MADTAAIGALKEYRFAEWRAAHGDSVVDLTDTDLSDHWHALPAILAGLNLSGSKLPRMLSGAEFAGSDISRCDLEGASLFNCDFRQGKALGLRARGATFHQCRFAGVVLSAHGSGPLLRFGDGLGGNTLVGGMWVRVEGAQADLSQARLYGCDLSGCVLDSAVMAGAELCECDLSSASLEGSLWNDATLLKTRMRRVRGRGASFVNACMRGVDLSESDFRAALFPNADLSPQVLIQAHNTRIEPGAGIVAVAERHIEFTPTLLADADLSGSDLRGARLVETNLTRAKLDGALVYGASAWRLQLTGISQQGLIASALEEPALVVDDIELAQFIYLISSSEKLRRLIDVLASRLVLILGRFAHGGRARLSDVAEAVRSAGLTPVIFDFKAPDSRSLTETVRLLWSFAKYVIADLTDPSSVPHELASVYQAMPSVPLLPLIVGADHPYSMASDMALHDWVLPVARIQNAGELQSAVRASLPALEAKRVEKAAVRQQF